jgi:hypothetical protein
MSQPQHEQLLAAGWRYDATQDRYAAPGSPTDGTARWHNRAAAWLQFQADQLDSASAPPAPTPPKGTRAADPRVKEPE